jgi:hypothetical protein
VKTNMNAAHSAYRMLTALLGAFALASIAQVASEGDYPLQSDDVGQTVAPWRTSGDVLTAGATTRTPGNQRRSISYDAGDHLHTCKGLAP